MGEESEIAEDENNNLPEGEGMREDIPSIADIVREGAPVEYIPLLVLALIITIIVIVLFVRTVNDHRRYITKHTMQGLCSLGIVLTFPVYTIMYYSGIIVPKAMAKVTFLAETYEALSLLLFHRLLLTYMGGKKKTVDKLKGHPVPLTSPPLCCMVCLPTVKFGKKFLLLHEIFIIQLVIFQLVLGYIDLLIGLDASHTYPASLIEETYSHYFHGFILLSLLLAIYGLGGIYHAAEQQLKHRKIFHKFILYKAFVTVVKLEELLVTLGADKLLQTYKWDLSVGAISGELRVHMWCYFLVMVEAAVLFPFLLRVYSTADYPDTGASLLVEEGEEEIPMLEVKGDRGMSQPSDYVSFPEAASLDRPDSSAEDCDETVSQLHELEGGV